MVEIRIQIREIKDANPRWQLFLGEEVIRNEAQEIQGGKTKEEALEIARRVIRKPTEFGLGNGEWGIEDGT